MNATLQCLANIKPITDNLLNQKNYNFLYQNNDICKMTIQYIQVLIGLFCSESTKGSFCPENFKKAISELNPLFQGVQANDSKDLIIFLLEIMNNELVKIHNKKYNINNNGDELYQKIDTSNEYMVLNFFLENFKRNYCSIIGNYLIGFNKSVFICQNCKGETINFNIFNLLIFSLEATSNYYNLGINNNSIPVINFNHCFGFLSKEEIFQDTYCQKCRKTGISKYRETIYSFPLYLIIILNRGKGNIFNCHVQIPEKFNPSIYVEKKNQNDEYELIGIVTHFGESGMGGHFIAFCKHNIDGKWRCYNDSIVTECNNNDYLNKGTPYILFYKKMNIEKEEAKDNKKENQINNNMINMNVNNQFNLNNNIYQGSMFPYNNYNQQYNMNYQQNMNNNFNCYQNFNSFNNM
jgi:ubiquitin C-terminal hydrolase